MSSYELSSMDEFCISQEDAEEMARRLQVDMSIIIYNAIQFRDHCNFFCHLHEYHRRHVQKLPFVPPQGPQLKSKQMAEALEFFLQMDGKLRSFVRNISVLVHMFVCFSGCILHENLLVSWCTTTIG